MHQSTTLSLSQTIWPRWASRLFHTLPIVKTLLPVTFAYSLSSEAVVIRQLRRWKRLWQRSLAHPHKRTSKMQSDALEERYAIKFGFKLEKMTQKRMECFNLLLEHFAWIEHQFLSGIRDSRKARSLWGMMRGVGGVRKSIHQSWLAKGLGLGLGLGLLCWGFKGVQKDASTLQIGSVAFPPGQCTSPQIHPCYRLFDQDGHQDSSLPSL